ncbi:hypothetical protein PL11201_580035 [Planktothrix sp. PCC 11201]|nr:hypothetical protein PL11201_580035 [Planktothrix sp. PCC 11201]
MKSIIPTIAELIEVFSQLSITLPYYSPNYLDNVIATNFSFHRVGCVKICTVPKTFWLSSQAAYNGKFVNLPSDCG